MKNIYNFICCAFLSVGNAAFNNYALAMSEAGSTSSVSSGLQSTDNYIEKGNLSWEERDRLVHMGDLVTYDLNVRHQNKAVTTYQVTQIQGAAAEFNVVGDQLRILMPVLEEPKLEGMDGVRFRVKPSSAPEYEVYYHVLCYARAPAEWDISQGAEEPEVESLVKKITGYGYVRNNIVAGDLSKLRWVVQMKAQENTIVPGSGSPFLSKGDNLIRAAPDADLTIINDALQFEADQRALRIKPEAISTLNKYIDGNSAFAFHFTADVYPTDEKSPWKPGYNLVNFSFNIHVAPLQLSVKLIDADSSKPIKGDFRLALQEVSDGMETNLILPTKSDVVVFEHLYAGKYSLKLIDLHGDYSAADTITLLPADTQKTVTLLVKKGLGKLNRPAI